ncbi:MAG: hypothetical protein IH845_00425 [Nanoarchaeota archaeon]|nr:hypothetical protein [Nanoarchaeota archaeon]
MNLLVQISILLIISLIVLTKSALNMITEKRIGIFIPFFGWGISFCLSAGLMFYGFFDLANEVILITTFISVLAIFYIIMEATK